MCSPLEHSFPLQHKRCQCHLTWVLYISLTSTRSSCSSCASSTFSPYICSKASYLCCRSWNWLCSVSPSFRRTSCSSTRAVSCDSSLVKAFLSASLLDISHCNCCTSPGASKNPRIASFEKYAPLKTTESVVSCEYYTGLFEMSVGVLTTCQFGTNSIIMLMFVESQRVHI